MAIAAARSREIGANGKLSLEALPGACGFYENLHMAKQPGASPDGHAIYVMEPRFADRLLDEIKTRGILNL
jgi:hypothetical protein